MGLHVSGGVRRRDAGGIRAHVLGVGGGNGGVVEQPQLAEVASAVHPLGAHGPGRQVAQAGVFALNAEGYRAAVIGIGTGARRLADDGVVGDGGEIGSAEVGRVVHAVAVFLHVTHHHGEAGRLQLRLGSFQVDARPHIVTQLHRGRVALGGEDDGAAIGGVGAGGHVLSQHGAVGGSGEVGEAAGGGVVGNLGFAHHKAQPLKGGLGSGEILPGHSRHRHSGRGIALHGNGDAGAAIHKLVLGTGGHTLGQHGAVGNFVEGGHTEATDVSEGAVIRIGVGHRRHEAGRYKGRLRLFRRHAVNHVGHHGNLAGGSGGGHQGVGHVAQVLAAGIHVHVLPAVDLQARGLEAADGVLDHQRVGAVVGGHAVHGHV